MSVRKIVFAIAIILFVVLGLTTLAGWILYKRFISPFTTSRELPVEIREARVIVGADFLSRNQFFKSKGIESIRDLREPEKVKGSFDSIEDIATGELNGRPGIDIGIAGRMGALIVDGQGNIQEQSLYQFEKKNVRLGPVKTSTEKMMLGDMQIVDIEGDGVCEYLGRGSLDGAAIFDHQGKPIWTYGEHTDQERSIADLAVGDVDGDGVAEFAASRRGLELFDRYGVKRWQQPDKYSSRVEITDTNGDGKPEIITQTTKNSITQLTIRDAQGQIIKSVYWPIHMLDFSLNPTPDGKGTAQILSFREEKFWLIDLSGKVLFQLEAPLSELDLPNPEKIKVPGMPEPLVFTTKSIYKAEGLWVKLHKDIDPYFAVIARFALLDRSLFYVYDSKGKLVYHEVMPEECHAIAILKSEDENAQASLLVSGQETVWRYAAR